MVLETRYECGDEGVASDGGEGVSLIANVFDLF